LRAELDRIPAEPHTAGGDLLPRVKRHVDNRVATLQSASKGLRDDADPNKARQAAREAALLGNRNLRDLAVSSD
jgi:hypothetical protein